MGVGIAMCAGTDVMMQSVGISFLKGNQLGMARAIRLSCTIMRSILQNPFFAFFYNAWGIALAQRFYTNSSACSSTRSLSAQR